MSSDDSEPEGDTSCDVCGEECHGTDFVDLVAWRCCSEQGDGVSFYPSEEPVDLLGREWQDVNSTHWVHRHCLAMFFEGCFASLPTYRAEGS